MTTLTDTATLHFPVNEIPKLVVTNPVGEVLVVPGDANEISIQVIKEARSGSDEEAQRALDEISVTATQTGETINVVVRLDKHPFVHAQQTVRLLVTVPSRTNLQIEVSAGRLRVDGITGTLISRVAAGKARFHQVTLAEQSRLRVDTGKVELDGALAPGASLDVLVHTGAVALTLPATTAAHFDATTSVGSILVSGWPVSVRRHLVGATAAGDLGAAPESALAVKVNVGSLSLSASE
jgi:hypothetical protein